MVLQRDENPKGFRPPQGTRLDNIPSMFYDFTNTSLKPDFETTKTEVYDKNGYACSTFST
jgi:hypothetical protein